MTTHKLLIVGRSASGKDSLASELGKYGLTAVKSYATRPKRYPEEDTHLFVSDETADRLWPEAVATTQIGQYRYFAMREQVEDSDVYIIDPNGVFQLIRTMPDTKFDIVLMKVDKDISDIAQRFAVSRAEDQNAERLIFDERRRQEDAEFSEFEQRISSNPKLSDNCELAVVYTNDYSDNLKRFAYRLALGFWYTEAIEK